jgi:lipoate-protein ligase A
MATLSLIDLTLPTPEENLALDEALLIECEETSVEALRFWESPVHFVVLGVAGKVAADVREEECARAGVPILRRASGGGTVLQGPGCLNFSLALSLEARPDLHDLGRSYCVILERTARSLGIDGLAHEGTSDIARAGMKVSGNAQKRGRRALLHHGTVLHGFDLGLAERCLAEPEKQPAYRARRPHREFLENIPLSREEIAARIARAWEARPESPPRRIPSLDRLIAERYGNPEWTRRF